MCQSKRGASVSASSSCEVPLRYDVINGLVGSDNVAEEECTDLSVVPYLFLLA